MNAKRIGIVGAGAIGGWVGVRLAQQGHEISVFARGATLAAVKGGDWRLDESGQTLHARVAASDNAAELGEQDILVIALKGQILPVVAPLIAPMIGPETIIVSMMNGVPWWFLLGGAGMLGPTTLRSVDPHGSVAGTIPLNRVIGNVVHASAGSKAPGYAVHNSGNRLIFGEPDGTMSERLDRLCALFTGAGFDVKASPRIRYDIWYKLWGNMTMNPIAAITGATLDKLLDDPLVSKFVLQIMAEAKLIGSRIDCEIVESGEDRNAVTRKLGAIRTSMLQDRDAGRPLEIDPLLSAPREIARLLAIPTPNLDALTGIVRLLGRTAGLYPAEPMAAD